MVIRNPPNSSSVTVERIAGGVVSATGVTLSSRRFRLATAPGQDAFGVAVGLVAALEDEVEGGLEPRASVEMGRHVSVAGAPRILPVDHGGHLAERLHD